MCAQGAHSTRTVKSIRSVHLYALQHGGPEVPITTTNQKNMTAKQKTQLKNPYIYMEKQLQLEQDGTVQNAEPKASKWSLTNQWLTSLVSFLIGGLDVWVLPSSFCGTFRSFFSFELPWVRVIARALLLQFHHWRSVGRAWDETMPSHHLAVDLTTPSYTQFVCFLHLHISTLHHCCTDLQVGSSQYSNFRTENLFVWVCFFLSHCFTTCRRVRLSLQTPFVHSDIRSHTASYCALDFQLFSVTCVNSNPC